MGLFDLTTTHRRRVLHQLLRHRFSLRLVPHRDNRRLKRFLANGRLGCRPEDGSRLRWRVPIAGLQSGHILVRVGQLFLVEIGELRYELFSLRLRQSGKRILATEAGGKFC